MSWWDRYIAAWNAHDSELLANCYLAEGVHIGASGMKHEGRAALVDYARGFTERFSSDHHASTISFVENGERFASEWEWRGTFDRDNPRWGPANGKAWEIRGASLGALEDGQIREIRDYWDTHRFYVQIEFVPR